MADPNFVYQKVNLEKMKESELLQDFFIVYSRFLDVLYDIDRPFDEVREDLIKLARRGELRSLALYLSIEKESKLKEDLVLKAKEIENRVGEKTPEEWEVIAALHENDRVNVIIDDSINTVKKLNLEMSRLWTRFNEYENEYDHFRYVDPFDETEYSKEEFKHLVLSSLHKCRWYYKCMQGGPYSDAIKQAQIGYYERYFKYKDSFDLYSFLELNRQPLKFYRENKILERVDGGKCYSRWELVKFLKKDYKNLKNDSGIIGRFCVLRGIDLIDEELGLLNWLKFGKKIKATIKNTAKETLRCIKSSSNKADNLDLGKS